jgi:hypothetical protein
MVREEHATYRAAAARIGVSRSTVCLHVVTAHHHFRTGLRSLDIAAPLPANRRVARCTRRGAPSIESDAVMTRRVGANRRLGGASR